MFSFLGRWRIAGMILALSGCAAAAASSGAAGRADTPGDYSHVIPVSVSGKQAVVQLQLPRAVYLKARSNDLRDLRLFDSAGTPMSFSLVERAQQEQVSRSTVPAAVFPVRAPAGARQGLPDGLQIRTRDDGAVISVTVPSARGAGDELASLVLDLQPPRKTADANERVAVSALALTLPRTVDNYNARLAVDTSDDLQRWEPLTEASVSWLVNSRGATVRNNRIEFAPRPFRYARIGWLEGKPVEFAEIAAEFVTSVRAPQQWESVVLAPAPGNDRDDLIYTAPVALPVQAVGVVFHAQNVVLPALVGQYREQQGREQGRKPGADLRPLTGATFYQLTQDGQRRVSGDVAVPVTHASRWVLRPQAKLSDRPDLRLLWKPASIVFMAGGKGPYTLAFGRDGAQPGYQALAQVAPGFSLAELAVLEQARAGAPVQQHEPNGAGEADRLASVFQRREFWLWALLLCGVAALAMMAWRLTRQLKDGSSGQPPA
jgi:hypothetical protein